MFTTLRTVVLALACLALVAARPATRRVVVIAHRGEHLHHPENTLPAIDAAIALGVDYVTIDVRTTADGVLVLSHDPTVDRCSDGHGAVAAMTLAQIRTLDAGIRSGPEFAGTRIPTLDEALDLARGRAGLYLNVRAARAADLARHIQERGMASQVVIFSRLSAELARLDPRLTIMPEAVNAEIAKTVIARLHPHVMAFGERDFTPEVVGIAKAANVRVYVDRFGAADDPRGWQGAIDGGADGIQTDHPRELLEFLRAHD